MMNTFGAKVDKEERFDEKLRNIGFTKDEIEKIKTAMQVLREFYEKKGKIEEYRSFEDNFMLFVGSYCKVCGPWKKKHVVKGITASINYKINGFDNISLFNTFQTQLERNIFIDKWNSFFSSFGLGIEAFSYSGKAGYRFIDDSFSLKFEELTQNRLNDPIKVYAILTNTYMIDVAIKTLEREFMGEYNKKGGLLYIGNVAEEGTSWVTSKIKKGLKEIGVDDKGLIMGKPAREYYFEKVKKALEEYKKLKEELLNLTGNIFYNRNTLHEINQTKSERIQEIFKRMKEIVGIIKDSLIELRINNSYIGIAFNVMDAFDIAFILTGPTALIKKGFKKTAKELVEKVIKAGFKGFLKRWGFASVSTFGFLFLYENWSEEYGENLMEMFSQNTQMYNMIRTELEKEGVKLEDVDAYLKGDGNKLSLEQKIAVATAFSLAAVVVPAHTRHANENNIMPLLKSILLFDYPTNKASKLFDSMRGVIRSLEQIRQGIPNNKILFEKKVRKLLQTMKDVRIKNLIEKIIYSGKYLSEEENVKRFKKYLREEIVEPLIRIWSNNDESAKILLNTAEHKFNLLELYKKGGRYEEALHEFFNLLHTLFGREVMRIEERIKKLNNTIYLTFNKGFINDLKEIRNKVERMLKEAKKKREVLIKNGVDTTQIDNKLEKLEETVESLNLLIETKNIMEEFIRSGGKFNISDFVDHLMGVKYAFLDLFSLNLSDEKSMRLLRRVKENLYSIEGLINGISSEYSDFINNPIFMYITLETNGKCVKDFANIAYNAIKRQEGGWGEVRRYFDELKRVKIYDEKPQLMRSVEGSATCIAFNIEDVESVDITPENLKFFKNVNLGVDKVTMSNPYFLERIGDAVSIAMSNPQAFSKVGYGNTTVMDRMGRKADLFRRIRAHKVRLYIKNENPRDLPLFEAKLYFQGKAYRIYLTVDKKTKKVYLIGIQPKNKQKLRDIKIVIQ